VRTRRPRQPVRRERPIRTGRADRPLLPTPSIALRVAVLVGVALVLVAVILFRLWFLQILSAGRYVDQANDNRLRSLEIVAPRGAIIDRDGKVIVENRPGLAIGIRPMDVPEEDFEAVTDRLAKVLGMRPKRIRRELEEYGGYPYDLVILKEDVTRKVVGRVLERKDLFPGVEVQRTYLRSYPQGDLAAHLLGHLGEISAEQLKLPAYRGYAAGDVIGQGGVEAGYDRWLRGRDGVAKIEVDAYGRPKGSDPVGGRLPESGDTLMTTLDADVQKTAEKALRYGIGLAHANHDWAANGAAAVVLDVRNGEVLAMASYPSFDPEVYVGGLSPKEWAKLKKPSANQPLVSKAFQGLYAPGSTYKAIDAVAALEEGVISPYTRFYCNGRFPSSGELGKTHWNCWLPGGHGHDNVTEALSESCDVFFYNVGYGFYRRPGSELAEWSVRLGLGRPTGLDIPGEAGGLVPTPEWRQEYFESEVDKIWKPGNSILMAIGQGDLQVTPLQMAVAYAAIANGGKVVQPHLALKTLSPQGKVTRKFVFDPRRDVDISSGTLEQVRKGLRMAATVGTSGPVFAGYPVEVAGKTGTAEVYGKGDYAWYASYAPYDDPKYAVVVMVEQGGHGGAVAAPAARMIYDALFDLDTGLSTGATGTD
jgi:penicillin-binding protein 2